ncbi:AAA family ATPase [Pyxidicoccus fallax]|uniref:AAA family ATPase n=1 Tax=Pyxidicoccus fallax TaxID=394095 RepID=A0A848LF84_9BACT|nr:AAA family ATPase [Pyxidicoccus fallax]NMO14961.1 AAA family ATPase [Pyxidicoccus fallax]NPC79724.1 AAA family ATPase [Pyxidicoccus fallax]
MYLRRLKVRNLKLLRDVEISFERNGEVRPWTVFVAENGLCKTALLQAIAMAASGPTLASELADVASLPDRRHPEEETLIAAEFSLGRENHRLRQYPGFDKRPIRPPTVDCELTTQHGWREFKGWSSYGDKDRQWPSDMAADPLREARREQLPYWFVAGYGVDRSLPPPGGTRRTDLFSDPIKQRLENLFDQRKLTATGFSDFLETDLAHAYNHALIKVLLADKLLPRITEVRMRHPSQKVRSVQEIRESHLFHFEQGGASVPIPTTWLSRGYQSTIAWLADLIGQFLLEAGTEVDPRRMEGLVLIDELDLHLHPTWQAALIPALKHVFPKLQFIGTTHSAMLLPGLVQDEVLLLKQDEEGNVVVEPAPASPALMTGSEIFESFFGIHHLYPDKLGQDLQRFGYLASNPYRSDDEEREMGVVLNRLKKEGVEPGWTPVARQKPTVAKPRPSSKRRVTPGQRAAPKRVRAGRTGRKKR